MFFLVNLLFTLNFAFVALSAPVGGAGAATGSQCPDYADFSKTPQGKSSTEPLGLPFMRPAPECRTFKSVAVEKVIKEMTSRMKDPDLARLFENTFPNTLDTTVKFYDPAQNLAFIITGDITAQWLRDTSNQFAAYYPLLSLDKDLAQLMRAPPPESVLPSSHNDWVEGVEITPPVDYKFVFECKYELDSFSSFLKLSRSYHQETGDGSIFNDNWNSAMDQILKVMDEQSQPSLGKDGKPTSPYKFSGLQGLSNDGFGEPRDANGLVATTHRPSDDHVELPLHTADNAVLSVELGHIADVADQLKLPGNLSDNARKLSQRIRQSIMDNTIFDGIFAYETDGFGKKIIMDDANVPSLLSLPYLGFLDKNDPKYVATRKVLLSDQNPYYKVGPLFTGIGPHEGGSPPWPMSHVSSIFGTDNDEEILASLKMLLGSTNGLGLIHEAVYEIPGAFDPFTRPWFAWANSYFAEMMLDLAQRKPGLIFKDDVPYSPRSVRLP